MVTSKKRPLVSIILPTYNRAHLIVKAIASVLAQSYENFELIVVDDCSTDNTCQRVKDIHDSRLSYIQTEKNRGPAYARNKGIKISKGEYIAFQDDDDYWMVDKLQKQVDALENNPSFSLAYSGVWRNKGGRKKYNPAGKNVKYTGNLFKRLLRGNFITIHVLVKRKDFIKAGCFDESLPALEDWDMWLKMSKKHDFVYIGEPLVVCHETSESVNNNWRNTITATKMIVKKHYHDIGIHKRTHSHHYFRTGKILMANGYSGEGIKNIFIAIGIYPLNLYYWLTLLKAFIQKTVKLVGRRFFLNGK